MTAEPDITLDRDELAALRTVARAGALDRVFTGAAAELTDRLDLPREAALRTLRRLREAGYLTPDGGGEGRGEGVRVTDAGRVLLAREYADYCRLFDSAASLRLAGAVTEGVGAASGFVSLGGYVEQFRERLGYEPFHGTLNVAVDEGSRADGYRLEAREGVRVDGWESDGRTYGGVTCHPVTVETADGRTYEPAHVIVPDRTRHDASELEILAPDRLRDELGLRDGDAVIVHVSA